MLIYPSPICLSLSLQIISTPRQLAPRHGWRGATTASRLATPADCSSFPHLAGGRRLRLRAPTRLAVEPGGRRRGRRSRRLGGAASVHGSAPRREVASELSRRCSPGAALPSSYLHAPPRGCLILSLSLLLLLRLRSGITYRYHGTSTGITR